MSRHIENCQVQVSVDHIRILYCFLNRTFFLVRGNIMSRTLDNVIESERSKFKYLFVFFLTLIRYLRING